MTDAMPTVGASEPSFDLGGERIQVDDGVLRNAAGSLAGSHLTMIEAVRNVMAFAGVDWQEAVRMASTYPSRAIGRSSSLGLIAPGAVADLVELDDKDGIQRVWRRGVLAYSAK